MASLLPLGAGAVLALVFVGVARARPQQRALRLYALGLVVAAFIYVGFSLRGAPFGWIGLEVLGLLVFGGMAQLGLHRSPWWLVAGWTLHTGWDVALHGGAETAFVPGWYPMLCLAFDLIVAAALALRLRRPRP